jgi:hypothetical protein
VIVNSEVSENIPEAVIEGVNGENTEPDSIFADVVSGTVTDDVGNPDTKDMSS